jgi:transposase
MSFVPAMVDRENAVLLPGVPSQSAGGQIVIETGALSIRIPSDVSADHIERVLLAVQVSA